MAYNGNTKAFSVKAFFENWDFTTDVDDIAVVKAADGTWSVSVTEVVVEEPEEETEP